MSPARSPWRSRGQVRRPGLLEGTMRPGRAQRTPRLRPPRWVTRGINGKQVEVIAEDGACNAKSGVLAIQKLINQDKVKIIMGAGCSSETLGAAPIAEENKIILISWGSSSPDITKSGDYIFRFQIFF